MIYFIFLILISRNQHQLIDFNKPKHEKEAVEMDTLMTSDQEISNGFPLLKPPPPYSVVVTPATPRTPTSQIRFGANNSHMKTRKYVF